MAGSSEVIEYLNREVKSGKHWYLALLEAVGMWTVPEEVVDGRFYRYLLDGEALDWLLVAERLCSSLKGLVPGDEEHNLIFYGVPPIALSAEKLRELLGAEKFRQHLNYYYGVVVEEALIQAVREEVRKSRWSLGFVNEPDYTNEVFRLIYETTRAALLNRFRREKKYPQLKSISYSELKEFTYWLFKLRLKECDKARVASDTKKAVEWLRGQNELKKAFEPK
ncbi:hypothetical protein ACFLXC_00555 [Chloroflexota bacterium]